MSQRPKGKGYQSKTKRTFEQSRKGQCCLLFSPVPQQILHDPKEFGGGGGGIVKN